MQILKLTGVRIDGVVAAVPARAVENVEAPSTGIRFRRQAEPGESALDYAVRAAEVLMRNCGTRPEEIGAVISVSFTQFERMPASAVRAQHRLGLPGGLIAFDVMLACSGYGYGLYLAGLLARQTGRRVLLLDGDVQSAFQNPADVGTRAVLADGATATLVSPGGDAVWEFAFAADGAKGDLLRLPRGGQIAMDGFGVFKFVASDVVALLRAFLTATGVEPSQIDAFVPHQANVYMIRQLTQSLGIAADRLWISGDVFGNLSSASVPTTIAHAGRGGLERVLLSGFGGGLSFFAALVNLPPDCRLTVVS